MQRSTSIPQNRIEQSLQSLESNNRSNRLNRAVADWGTLQKPQISSIPGISAKERNRYRVTLNGEILATGLTSDQALELVKRGGKA